MVGGRHPPPAKTASLLLLLLGLLLHRASHLLPVEHRWCRRRSTCPSFSWSPSSWPSNHLLPRSVS